LLLRNGDFKYFIPVFTGYKIVPVFGLYAIPFKTSAVVFLTIFLRPERSIIPSTDPFAGFTTAIASFHTFT
jgi:hypothetical protein